jgi:glycosyltransferase involved in cell wall biosynthesis
LRAADAFDPALDDVQWDRVDAVAADDLNATEGLLRRRIGELDRAEIHRIPFGLDVPAAPVVQRTAGKNLVCLDPVSHRHNPALLIQCFARLLADNAEYRLIFGGYFVDDMLTDYLRHMVEQMGLSQAVRFEPRRGPLSAYLRDKHVLVSADMLGDYRLVLQAMARGLKPVVHASPSANEMFPPEHLFRTPEEFCRAVLDTPHRPTEWHRYVAERFPLAGRLRAVNALLCDIERRGPANAGQDEPANAPTTEPKADAP